jgi:Mce-associated membrane protein
VTATDSRLAGIRVDAAEPASADEPAAAPDTDAPDTDAPDGTDGAAAASAGTAAPADATAADPADEAAEATAGGLDADRPVTDSDDPSGGEDPTGAAEPAGRRAQADRTGARRTAALAVLAVLAVALAGLATTLGLDYHRARVRAATEAAVLAPAKTAAARLLSYDYRHIDQDAAQASAVLTGVFKGQYEAVMRQQIVPQAPKQRAVVQAEVLAAGVTTVSPDGAQAVVLVFANQTVSNTSSPQPRVDQVRVRLTLDRVDGVWLVSKVDAL